MSFVQLLLSIQNGFHSPGLLHSSVFASSDCAMSISYLTRANTSGNQCIFDRVCQRVHVGPLIAVCEYHIHLPSVNFHFNSHRPNKLTPARLCIAVWRNTFAVRSGQQTRQSTSSSSNWTSGYWTTRSLKRCICSGKDTESAVSSLADQFGEMCFEIRSCTLGSSKSKSLSLIIFTNMWQNRVNSAAIVVGNQSCGSSSSESRNFAVFLVRLHSESVSAPGLS
jgi:hypothetical protein